MATLAALENLGVARSAFGTRCPVQNRQETLIALEVTIYRLTSSEGIGKSIILSRGAVGVLKLLACMLVLCFLHTLHVPPARRSSPVTTTSPGSLRV